MYSALLVLVLLISPSLLFATESESADRVPTIRGVVYDETDTPLASATVQIEGTTIGTTTNSEGRFILRNLAHKVYKINISFVGYALKPVQSISPQKVQHSSLLHFYRMRICYRL